MTAASINQSAPAAVAEALACVSEDVQADGQGAWRLRSIGPAALAIQVRINGQWALFNHVPAINHIHGVAVVRCAWELLACNAQLRGPAGFGLNPAGTHVELGAEVLIEPIEGDLPARMRYACQGMGKRTHWHQGSLCLP